MALRPCRRLAAALLLAGVIGAPLACGGGSSGEAARSARQILADATHAATAATSVHVVGTITTQGQNVPVDLRLTDTGGAVGTSAFAGTKVDLVRVADSLYVRGAQEILGSFLGAKVAARIDGHWVEISTTMPQLEQLVVVTDMRRLLRQTLTAARTPAKAGTRTVDGRKVVALTGFGANGTATLLVAASGPPHPVRLVTDQGAVTFSDWNAVVSVRKPADVVSLASLIGG